MRIKLRREFQGQDSWGAYLEEVGLTNEGHLSYRQSSGGNCCYGRWEQWEGEYKAVEFLLGPVAFDIAVGPLRALIDGLPTLEPVTVCELGKIFGRANCNYGGY